VKRLRKAIQEAYDIFHPKAIAVFATCPVGLIGDDVHAVAREMKEKLGINVMAFSCEGYKGVSQSAGHHIANNGVFKQPFRQVGSAIPRDSSPAEQTGKKLLLLLQTDLNEGFAGAMDAISRTILINVWEAKQPFSILTVRQRFDDMLIERLRFPRDENTGYSLAFEMDIKHVTIVTPLTVPQFTQVAENVISGTGATSIGSQATQDVSAQLQSQVQASPNLAAAPGMNLGSPGYFGSQL